MKFVFKMIKRVIIACFCLYFYNIISIKFNLIIPINIFSIAVVSCFDLFGLIGLILFRYFIL